MVNIKNEEKIVEEDILEQNKVEQKLKKYKKEEKKVKVEKKKGQKFSFAPARRLPTVDNPTGYVAAWKENTPENIRRLLQEGWEIANRIDHNIDIDMGDYYRKINDDPVKDKESTITHNEMICMLLPEEIKQSRDQYLREETEKQTRAKIKPENNSQNKGIVEASKIQSTIEIN